MVGGNVDHIHGRDLYSATRPSRRNYLITIVSPAVYPRFFEFLYVDIQSTGRTLSRPRSRQPNDVMSESAHNCTVNFSDVGTAHGSRMVSLR